MPKLYSQLITTLGLVLLMSSCTGVGYYGQAVMGQWRILVDRSAIDDVLSDPGQPVELQAQLMIVRRVLDFAARTVGIDPEGRYQTYVDLDRPSVVWNVFAAAPDSIVGEQWCYPIIGCAPYRGYFKESAARAFANRLQERGLETYVAGVAAYSTLGWFEDPVMSTFVSWPEPDLAALLLHELAHGIVWLEGDVGFNESFASAVAELALKEYYAVDGRGAEYDLWLDRRADWARMKSRLLSLRSALADAYANGQTGEGIYTDFQARYRRDREALGNGRFDKLVFRDLNNAYLVSLGAYEFLVPAFRCLFRRSPGWEEFFAEIESVAELTRTDRRVYFERCLNPG